MMKHNGLILFIFILLLVLTLPMTVFAAAEEPAKIASVELKDALRGMMNKGVYDEIYPSELAEYTGEMDFSGLGITDLRGLEYFVNVESFNFSNNAIATLPSNLAQMENLKSLDLSFNDMYELPSGIADAPNLETLILKGNKLKTLPNRIQEMANLRNLDISGNRFAELNNRMIYLHLASFNCNYNFIDLNEGTISRNILDNMEVSGQVDAYKQLIALPKITYVTDNGDMVVKWSKAYDVPFYDGTTAEVAGYSILLDGVFQETVGPDETEYDLGFLKDGDYDISVSPDYQVEGFEDFALRYYTTINAIYGEDGPSISDNPEPVVLQKPNDEPVASVGAVATESLTAPTETDTDKNTDGPLSQFNMVTLILLGVAILLAAGLATMLVVFLKQKPEEKQPTVKKKK